MSNKITVTGRAGTDAELRFGPSGKAVANFRLCDQPRRKGQSGEWEDAGEPLWLSVTLWEAEAERAAEQVTKGSLVTVHGRLGLDVFQGRDGERRERLSVTGEMFTVTPKPQQGAGWSKDKPSDDPWAA